ncbi:MAG: ribose-phosphate pyrophosphokinase [Verrucomicrobia bacterium A1]|nr:MAG: ribose-phosphate pyrophosphokinase [Verrucomicrobia bacterium A1]
MKILSGTAHPRLAEGLAVYLGEPLGGVDIRRFPDGEVFVKIVDNIRGRDLYIVQPICDPPNENLMELLIMIDAAKRASAARITAVLPYFGYARQDRKDQPRVPITAKLVANLLVASGADRILTLDLHSQQIQGFFDIPVDHLTASPVMVKALRVKQIEDMVIVAPDTGGVKNAYAYSQKLGCGLAIAAKQRKSAREVESIDVVGDVKDRDVVLVDDLVTTAGTLCGAAALLKEHGARTIRAMVTHALVTPEGVDRLKRSAIEELITTDSVPAKDWGGFPVTILSIGELLGEAILRIHNNQSVTSLFKV